MGLNPSSPRPRNTFHVSCPACQHGISAHDGVGCQSGPELCRCQWTPNDIAHHLLVADLTPFPSGATFEPGS